MTGQTNNTTVFVAYKFKFYKFNKYFFVRTLLKPKKTKFVFIHSNYFHLTFR